MTAGGCSSSSCQYTHRWHQHPHNTDPYPQHLHTPAPGLMPACSHPSRHQAPGTRHQAPTCTRAASTNRPKSLPVGAPWYRAMLAPLSSAAYSSHGPIIQPRLVGQHSTPPGPRSCCAHASVAQRSGVMWVQGMAFGSPCRMGRRGELVGQDADDVPVRVRVPRQRQHVVQQAAAGSSYPHRGS
jgi:hypothetical protein